MASIMVEETGQYLVETHSQLYDFEFKLFLLWPQITE